MILQTKRSQDRELAEMWGLAGGQGIRKLEPKLGIPEGICIRNLCHWVDKKGDED